MVKLKYSVIYFSNRYKLATLKSFFVIYCVALARKLVETFRSISRNKALLKRKNKKLKCYKLHLQHRHHLLHHHLHLLLHHHQKFIPPAELKIKRIVLDWKSFNYIYKNPSIIDFRPWLSVITWTEKKNVLKISENYLYFFTQLQTKIFFFPWWWWIFST